MNAISPIGPGLPQNVYQLSIRPRLFAGHDWNNLRLNNDIQITSLVKSVLRNLYCSTLIFLAYLHTDSRWNLVMLANAWLTRREKGEESQTTASPWKCRLSRTAISAYNISVGKPNSWGGDRQTEKVETIKLKNLWTTTNDSKQEELPSPPSVRTSHHQRHITRTRIYKQLNCWHNLDMHQRIQVLWWQMNLNMFLIAFSYEKYFTADQFHHFSCCTINRNIHSAVARSIKHWNLSCT